jgi:hypothetical protein
MEVQMWRRGMLVACAIVCVVACRQNRSSPGGRKDGLSRTPIPRASRVRPLVLRLASTKKAEFDAARGDLRKWREGKAPSASEAIELLRASATRFPLDNAPGDDVATEVMQLVSEVPRPEYAPVIEELYPKLNPRASEAALVALSVIDDDAAAQTFVRLLRAHAGEMSEAFGLSELREKPHHGDMLFPGLLDLAKHDAIADEVYLTALEFCRQGEVTLDRLASQAPSLLAAYRREHAWLLPRQQSRGVGWMWTDAYQNHRRRAAILLDLAGCLPEEQFSADLNRALALRDPRLVFFALSSLLEYESKIPREAVALVAANPEMRNNLYDKLADEELTDLIPARYRTQAALAESNLVGWLVFPTELARVPDQIELKKVVSIDVGEPDGTVEYYLYRFRTLPPHWAAKDGWMAGVAGPFLRKEEPTTEAQGDTFSDFERWDARTPAEHVEAVQELLADWREKRRKEKEPQAGD